MARGKKSEKGQTIEERLEQALVPAEEQPYSVSENWCWIVLGNVTAICRGASPRPIKSFITDDATGINWIKIGDADSGKYIVSTKEKVTQAGAKKSVFVEKGTLLLSNSMSFGRPYILDMDGCIHDGWLAITPSKSVEKVYLYYALMASEWYFQQVAVGTAVRNLNSERVAKTPIPLPPLAEQQRIVDRIESLFARLDEAKEKAQAVVDGFEARKAVILHKAFTGELTKNWCIEYGADRKRWMTKNLGDITINHDSQRIPLSREERSSLAHLFDYYGASGVIDRVDRFIFEGRFLLIGEDGANLVMRSKPIAFIAEGQFWVNNHAHVLDTADEISMDFLCYYINSIDLTSYITGSAQPKMTQAKMNSIPVPVPTIDEQGEIVRILDTLLAKEQQAKETAEAVLDQIEAMKKSILARAFRGELGTNDPTEESAVELLKQVL